MLWVFPFVRSPCDKPCQSRRGFLFARSVASCRMTSDCDIWTAANELVKHHVDTATLVAAERADDLLAAGDMQGRRTWIRIMRVLKTLQGGKPTENERVH